MIAEPQFPRLTPQDYLAWEAEQAWRYAYVAGEVFAMTGGTIPHNQIALNLAAALKAHLRGRGCLVAIADVKVEISERGPYHYPDVMVSCDPRDRQALQFICHPSLIVEVLSPSTASYDRGDKFEHYRQLPALHEYLLIDSTQIAVTRYRRLAARHWDLHTYLADEAIELASVGWQVPVALLYEDVRWVSEDSAGSNVEPR